MKTGDQVIVHVNTISSHPRTVIGVLVDHYMSNIQTSGGYWSVDYISDLPSLAGTLSRGVWEATSIEPTRDMSNLERAIYGVL